MSKCKCDGSDEFRTISHRKLSSINKNNLVNLCKLHGIDTDGLKQQLKGRLPEHFGLQSSPEKLADKVDRLDKTVFTDEIRRHYQHLPSRLCNLRVQWSKSLDRVPKFTHRHWEQYFIHGTDKSVDEDSLCYYKSTEGYKLFEATDPPHLINVYFSFPPDGPFCFFKAKCKPKIDISKPPYNVTVCIDKSSANVYGADCNCVSGLGQICTHVSALLFWVEDAVSKKLQHAGADITPTQQQRAWGIPSQLKSVPKQWTETPIFTSSYDNKGSRPDKPRQVNDPRHPDDLDVQADSVLQLIDGLREFNPNCTWVRTVEVDAFGFTDCSHADLDQSFYIPSSDNTDVSSAQLHVPEEQSSSSDVMIVDVMTIITDTIDVVLSSVPFQYRDTVDLMSDCVQRERNSYMTTTYKMNSDTVQDIEETTRGQSASPCWYKDKIGKISATKFGRICKMRKSTPPDNVVREIFMYDYNPSKTTRQIKTGCENEQKIRSLYINVKRNKSSGAMVRESGFVVLPDSSFVSVSPDGLVTDDTCDPPEGLLEIKWVDSDQSVLETSATRKGFCLKLNEAGQLQLDKQHNYYYQIQAQMGVTNRQWCDFVLFTGKFEEFKSNPDHLYIERVKFCQQRYTIMLKAVTSFFVANVLAELFSSRVFRKKPLHPNHYKYNP